MSATSQVTRKPSILKGFRDYLPEQMILRQEIIGRFKQVFELHGFDPLDTPAIEYLEVLTGKAGENEKLMYAFEDHGGRSVGLRYDLTVPLARVVAMHQSEIVLPFKRYHVAPVWRADRPQRGRFREFWQCDADIAGVESMAADAEIISVLVDALGSVGLDNSVVHISHRRLLERIAIAAGVPEYQAATVYRSVDKLDKIGADGVKIEMLEGGISREAADAILETIAISGNSSDILFELSRRLPSDANAEGALAEMTELFQLLSQMGVDSSKAVLDLTLARGLDYYTGPVFEAKVTEPKVGSVAGGGRYEGLIGSFGSRPISATGVSLGLERIIEVVREHQTLPIPTAVAQVFVPVVDRTLGIAAELTRDLRAAGIKTDLSLLESKGLGEQLKYAGRRGIALAAIAGPDEAARSVVAIKDLASGEQIDIERPELIDRISSMIAATKASQERNRAE
ncbi:MAG TPA: histidine--tRNA ligase [Thermomicrobiales bacterium]|nr:histidine--tRNA ligase [Thermomicrobiales bacterium]